MNPILIKLAQLQKTGSDKEDQFDERIPTDEEKTEDGQKPTEEEHPGEQQQGAQEGAQEPVEQQEMPQEAEGPEDIGARAAQSFLGPEVYQAAMQGDPVAIDILSRTAGQIAAGIAQAAANAEPEDPAMSPEAMQQGGVMPQEGDPNAMAQGGGEMAPQQPMTPEEEVANQIVAVPEQAAAPMAQGAAPGQAQAPAQAPAQGPAQTGQQPQAPVDATPAQAPQDAIQPVATGPNGEPLYDEATIQKIIEMVKQGKI